MWSALALDAWVSDPAHHSTSSLSADEVPPTDTSGTVNAWPAQERNGTGGDSAPVRVARKRLTLFGIIRAIALWVLSKVRKDP